MADDKIDSYVDRNGVKGDTSFIVAELQSVQDKFIELKNVKLDLQGASGLANLAPTVQQAKVSMDGMTDATDRAAKTLATYNGHSKEFAQVLLLQTKAEKELASAQALRNKGEKELASAQSIKNKNSKEALKNIVAENKATADASNAYKHLSLAYNEASLKAKNYSLNLGATHPLTIEATKDAAVMGAKLKELDASTGTFNRNVGNYGGALAEYGKKAFGFIRTAANILPGLGLSGAFLLIFEGINKVFDLFKSKVTEAEKATKRFNEVNQKSIETYAEEKLQIEELVKRIKDEKTTTAEKGLILKEVNEKYENQIGHLSSINQLESVFVAKSKAMIDSLILRAKAQAAFALASEASKESLKAQLDLERALQIQTNNKLEERVKNGLIKAIKADIASAEKDVQGFLNLYEDSVKKANTTEIGAGIGAALNKPEKQKKESDKRIKAQDDMFNRELSAQQANEELKLQREIDYQNELAKNQKKSLLERSIALGLAFESELKLIDLRAEHEIANGKHTATEIKNIEEKAFGDRLKAESKYYEERDKLVYKANLNQNEGEAKVTKELEAQIKARIKAIQDGIDEANRKREKEKKEEEDRIKQKHELEVKLANDLNDLVFSLFTNGIDRQKNAIQEQIDLLEERKQKEIEVANQTIASAQDRAAAIIVIEARANAQKEAFQRRQRELDNRKAQFDKAQAIARIVQETAIALIQGVYKPALLPFVFAITAAELAAVIAQPIPRYKHGKNVSDDYEGPAIVGDGGKKEAIIREDGSVQITADTPQMTYVKKRDVVLPDANQLVNYVLAGHMGGRLAVADQAPDTGILELKHELRNVVSAIKKIPQPQIRVQGLIERRIRFGDSSNTYLNNNLQG
jgi:hypothetical protein